MRRTGRVVLAFYLVGALASTASAQAGAGRGFLFKTPTRTLSVYGGFAVPSAQSDLFEFTTTELTLGRQDFAGLARGADFGIRMSEHVEVVFGVAYSSSRTASEFRDWVDADDLPIEQVTSFTRVPVTLSLRYHPMPHGRKIGSYAWIPSRVDPYVGIGAGRIWYRFAQRGDFIDFDTDPDNPVVFTDFFRSAGWANVVQGAAGLGWTIAPQWQIVGEVRYQHAAGDLGGDFSGFDRLDLSGVASHVGFAVRF